MEREYKKIGTMIAWDKPGMSYNHGIFGVAVNEKNNHVYVSCFRTSKLLVVDGETNEYVDVIDLPGNSIHSINAWNAVVWSPVVNRMYVLTDKAIDSPDKGRLYVIDGVTEKLVKTLDLPLGVRGIAVDSETGNFFVTRYGTGRPEREYLKYCYIANKYVLKEYFNEVYVYDKNEQFVKKIEVEFQPWEITVDKDKTYVSCKGNNWNKQGTLCIIDNKRLEVIDRIKIGRKPRGVAVNNDKVYVACRYDSMVYVVDLKEREVITRIMVDNDCVGLTSYKNKVYLVTREGKKLLGEQYRGELTTLQVIDCRNDEVVKTLSFGKVGHYSAVNSKTGRLYVPTEDSNDLWTINLKTDEISKRILLGRTMDPHIINPKTGYVYAASHISDELSIFDGRNNRFVKAISVDGWPWSLAMNTRTNRIYVPCYDKALVSVVDGETHEIVDKYSLGTDGLLMLGVPQGAHGGLRPCVAVDEVRNRFYITGGDNPNTFLHIIEEDTKSIRRVYIGWSGQSGKIDIEVDEKNNKIYCLNAGFGLMTVIDGDTYEIIEKIDVSLDSISSPSRVGTYIGKMFIDAKKNVLYIGRLIFDLETKKVKGEITQEFGEKLEHFDIENRKFYFLDKSKQVINIVNADTYELEEVVQLERATWDRFEISVSLDPFEISFVVDPIADKIYVNPMPVQFAELDVYEK